MNLCLTSPKKVDGRIEKLLKGLGLDASTAQWLKQRNEIRFTPDSNNCHINSLVKRKLDGGQLVSGWIIAQDKIQDFVEAVFYSVWQGEDGKLVDVTPRPNQEKRLLFVPDPKRVLGLANHEGRPACVSFENVKMLKGVVATHTLKQKLLFPETGLIYDFGLAKQSG